MTKMKYQGIAKTIFCLSMLLNAGSANADPLDLEGPNLIGPRKPGRPKLEWEDQKPQDLTLIGPRKPDRPKLDWEHQKPQGKETSYNKGKSYVKTHNEMAKKYGLTNHIIRPRVSPSSTLMEESKKLEINAYNLMRHEQEELDKVNSLGRKIVDVVSVGADVTIDKVVNDKKANTGLTQLKDEGMEWIKKHFN
ncbi:MAG: hypothetical protein BGO67_04965 [Alphaproteobacteria bacterium 41-28]|nr:MAG: hypothetical protein BGO67_04965 [Alphaproteobacteria bacterium 41-28]